MFERCVRYISSRYRVSTIEELMMNPSGAKEGKEMACITFDDGFKDNIEYAQPILAKYGLPASFYVVTDSIDGGSPPWNHQFHRYFEKTDALSFELDIKSIPDDFCRQRWHNKEERVDFGRNLYKILKTIPSKDMLEGMNQISEQFSDVAPPTDYMMTWDDLRELQVSGSSIGSHTKSHLMLTNLSEGDLEAELAASRNRIGEELDQLPISISYPVGDYNKLVMSKASACGYEIGLAVGQKFYQKGEGSPMQIPRVDVYAGSGWFKTRMRMNGSLELIKRVVKV